MPTASAVVADLIAVASGTSLSDFRQMRIFPDTTEPAVVLPFTELQSRYYLRLTVRDVPGVMAQITKALGDHGISISAIMQRESEAGQFVPVVVTTHLGNEGAMVAACKEINALLTIGGPAVCLRIIDSPREFSGS